VKPKKAGTLKLDGYKFFIGRSIGSFEKFSCAEHMLESSDLSSRGIYKFSLTFENTVARRLVALMPSLASGTIPIDQLETWICGAFCFFDY
jgi:hypothetical protein